MTKKLLSLPAIAAVLVCQALAAAGIDVSFVEQPKAAACFDASKFVIKVSAEGGPPFKNPFTDAELTGTFEGPDGASLRVAGFCDSQDGSIYRLRFCPRKVGIYKYSLSFRAEGVEKKLAGRLICEPSGSQGPVVVDPNNPKHFIYAGSKKHFYHLGYTAYHLLDTSNDDSQIEAVIDYCIRNGFNKIRFLLTGYPRDTDKRTSTDVEYGVADPWKAPNYGSEPGQVNPLPAWPGRPHNYDFTRFNLAHWRRIDRAVKLMRQKGLVATCIITIEKQDLPKEYGQLTEHEYRLYRYAVARLAAFDNVCFDLGNEHNEFRDKSWGDIMGAFVKKCDPFARLASAHGYDQFFYTDSAWADFIITQQYGEPKEVHQWALKYYPTPKPYINEEYGYEGSLDKSGHGQSADRVRKSHWSIAMAGGYATYGDWSNGVSYFYMGHAGPGKAALQLKHLRSFFEKLPYWKLTPHDELATSGFCLAKAPEQFVFYFPTGGPVAVNLESVGEKTLAADWFDPRTGSYVPGPSLHAGKDTITCPSPEDWVLYVKPVNPK
ncbi:MAG: DUF4038 domain-containing protein [Sedimentisphaerales bacterium]|nr:DUF4038 domain-containing protein [Sedimentisphaerales bacterium]